MDLAKFYETIRSRAQQEKAIYDKMLEFDLSSAIVSETICNVKSLSGCTEAGLKKEIGDRTKNAVYVILTKQARFPLQKDTLESVYKKSGFSMSKINKKHEWKPEEGYYCLYVGSSKGNVVKRLVQHLGIAGDNSKVYALHMARWWPEAAVRIEVRQFKGEAEPYLQEIENMLWDYYQPIFGKRGPK
jgi:hypothetical protein